MSWIDMKEIKDDETRGIDGELVKPAELTPEETLRIKNRVMQEIQKKEKHRTPKKRRGLAIAAAIMCLFVLVSCSAAIFHWNSKLSQILNMTEQDKTYAEKNNIAQIFEKSTDSYNGVTITLNQALVADNLCYLIFDVEVPDKQVYFADGAPITEHIEISGLQRYSGPYTLSNHKSMTSDGNKLSMYVIGFYDETESTKIPIRISFKDITYRTISEVITIDGIWTLDCVVNRTSEVLSGKTNISCEITGKNQQSEPGTITGYKISPFSVEIDFTPDCGYYFPGDINGIEPDLSLVLVYKNGDTHSVNIEAFEYLITGQYDSSNNTENMTWEFCTDRLIELDDLQAIEFCGTRIDLIDGEHKK
ncbi:MAG: DUF4179 domain-containing protein [Christensenellaceae bacterium]|nr:DUF4179 domain-containing protein [Christensenellaceae bacterium]